MLPLEKKYRYRALLKLALAVGFLVAVNVVANSKIGGQRMYTALDLTEDKRFTLSDYTRKQLYDLEQPVFVRVLLEGDLPAPYRRLRTAIAELLEDLGGNTDYLQYEFVDPLIGTPEEVQERQEAMANDGIEPTSDLQQNAGERTTRVLYPYAIFYYGDRQRIVPLLERAAPDVPVTQQLNQAENLLEYNFIGAITSLTKEDKPVIGFTLGNGELPGPKFARFYQELTKDYEVGPVYLDSFPTLSTEIDLVIVAKPTVPFREDQVFKLDQYIMNGGKVMWAIDAVGMDYDSLRATGQAYPSARTTGLDALFFRYGFRVSDQLILDLANTPVPVVTGQGQPQLLPYPYHVLALPRGDNPIVKNIDPVDTRFPTLIESVGTDKNVRQTVMLASSNNSRRQRLPSAVDLNAQKFSLELDRFSEQNLPIAVLYEGVFSSPFANRLSRENEAQLRSGGQDFRANSRQTSMIVISDGDVMANSFNARTGEAGLLGVNQWSRIPYANQTFLLNAVAYLLNPGGAINSRSKEVKLRLLNQDRAQAEAGYWRSLNLLLPLALLALFGVLFTFLRRRRYAR